jgi:hypothetical protein
MTTAYFDTTPLDDQYDSTVSTLFQNAFNAWNKSVGGGWSISGVDGFGGTFTIDNGAFPAKGAGAFQRSPATGGGAIIKIGVSGTLPTLGAGESLVWIQGLYTDYTLVRNGKIVAPYYELDTDIGLGMSCTQNQALACAPAYPYQHADHHFFDQPSFSYQFPDMQQAFFDANAYLAVVNSNNKTVELLDGVSYGFQNYVSPEPGTFLLLGSGMLAAIFIFRQKRGVSQRSFGLGRSCSGDRGGG